MAEDWARGTIEETPFGVMECLLKNTKKKEIILWSIGET